MFSWIFRGTCQNLTMLLYQKKKKIKRQLVKLLWPRQKKKKTKASVGWGKTNKQKNKKQEQLRESS